MRQRIRGTFRQKISSWPSSQRKQNISREMRTRFSSIVLKMCFSWGREICSGKKSLGISSFPLFFFSFHLLWLLCGRSIARALGHRQLLLPGFDTLVCANTCRDSWPHWTQYTKKQAWKIRWAQWIYGAAEMQMSLVQQGLKIKKKFLAILSCHDLW